MPRFTEERDFPYSAQEMYDLIVDVAKYPDFLPWCQGARLYKINENDFHADLLIGFKMFREKFTSHVHHTPYEVRIDYVKGPLKYLNNEWKFVPKEDGGCELQFMVDFEFKNKIFQKMVGSLFTEAVNKMVHAFEKRAEDLYG